MRLRLWCQQLDDPRGGRHGGGHVGVGARKATARCWYRLRLARSLSSLGQRLRGNVARPTFSGLQAAARRAAEDDTAGRCQPVRADAGAIPFADNSFDAIHHSDVLCCLEAKLDVLRECRRVLRPTGAMVFSVLAICPGLSKTEAEKAADTGPAFVDTPFDYVTMLEMVNWRITKRIDVSAGFLQTADTLIEEEERHALRLAALRGDARQGERLATLRKRREGVSSGLICREVYQVAPVRE